MKIDLKNNTRELELLIVASGMSLEELLFERLDMGWPELFYDIHHRLIERADYFGDLLDED
jgi:hypothetical protein